jgi:hypothetical protein
MEFVFLNKNPPFTMTPRSLFNIILKVLGLYFIQDFLAAIPQFISVPLYFLSKQEGNAEGIWMLLTGLLTVSAYGCVAFYLIFKTDLVIEKLKLEKGFDQDSLPLNIHRSTVLSIAVIVIGGLLVVNEIPTFCSQLVSYFQEKRMTFGMTDPKISNTICSGVKILIGILLMTNQRVIVGWIEWKRQR